MLAQLHSVLLLLKFHSKNATNTTKFLNDQNLRLIFTVQWRVWHTAERLIKFYIDDQNILSFLKYSCLLAALKQQVDEDYLVLCSCLMYLSVLKVTSQRWANIAPKWYKSHNEVFLLTTVALSGKYLTIPFSSCTK